MKPEIDCEIVKIDPRSYRKEYPPMEKDKQDRRKRVPVNVSMSISAISNIHDIKESFQAKFTIILEEKNINCVHIKRSLWSAK